MTVPSKPTKALLQKIQRMDFQAFVEGAFLALHPNKTYSRAWYVDAICWHLHRVRAGSMPRLIVNLPPRMLKSFIVSIAWPAFLLGHNPELGIICISYSDDLAKDLARQFRALMESDYYRRLFPKMRVVQDSENQVTTAEHGYRLATSINGTLTGKGGDLIIIDDPLKAGAVNSESERKRVIDWYTSTLTTRLDDPAHSQIVLVMQRIHALDLSGYLLEGDDWTHLSLPGERRDEDQSVEIGEGVFHRFREGDLLDYDRLPGTVLEARSRELGTAQYHAQYLQNPVPPGGNIIKRDWLCYYDPGSPPYFYQVIQSWDIAAKIGLTNDWSVCVTLGVARDGYYVIDVTCLKREFPGLLQAAKELAQRYRPARVLIEESSNGIALLQCMIKETRYPCLGIKPTQDKEARLNGVSGFFECGRVKFSKGASWLEEMERELLDFPNGKHDDRVDSLVQALAYARDNIDDYSLFAVISPEILKDERQMFSYVDDFRPRDDDREWDPF